MLKLQALRPHRRRAVTHWPRCRHSPHMVASPPYASLKFSLILSISLGLSFFLSRSLSNLSLGWDEKKRRTRKKKERAEEREEKGEKRRKNKKRVQKFLTKKWGHARGTRNLSRFRTKTTQNYYYYFKKKKKKRMKRKLLFF